MSKKEIFGTNWWYLIQKDVNITFKSSGGGGWIRKVVNIPVEKLNLLKITHLKRNPTLKNLSSLPTGAESVSRKTDISYLQIGKKWGNKC